MSRSPGRVLLTGGCPVYRGSALPAHSFANQMNQSIMGTYVLALRLDEAQTVSAGRLGELQFPAGHYLYTGSAFGPGGLHARLARHRRRLGHRKRPHWHVDYLREVAVWNGAWVRASSQRLECEWAQKLRNLDSARILAAGFGASDCRCPAHLVYVPVLPDDNWLATTLGAERLFVEDEVLGELLHTLTTGDDASRETAALGLGGFGPDAIEPLASLLEREDPDTRWWAARALAEIGGQESIAPLLGALVDPDRDVRACAALALGRLGDGSAAPALASRLNDASAFVADIAADALSMLGEPAVPVLAERLEGKSAHARLLAVRALGRIKSQTAIAPLFGALEDPSYLVRHYAREALESLGVGMVYVAP
jgi:Uri superfamily endonuclease